MTAEQEKVEDGIEKKEAKEQEVPQGMILRSAPYEESRPDEKGCYGFKGGVLAFVDWDGQLYVTTGTRLKMELLEDSGFNKRRPRIEVPCSDGSVKSKRWLRKNLPPQEIKRSVEENLMPKQEAKVVAAIKQVNTDGLRPVDSDFLEQRCARVEGKNYLHIGLIASYRGVLSFTDWDANTYVTLFSEEKRRLLERSGYVYVGSMIKVPYALESPENREWLAANIPYEEWDLTEREVAEERSRQAMEEAKAKIQELGLKDLPAELLAASAACEENYPQYIGMAGAHNGVLAFTDPEGATYVTPAMAEKVELLKSLGYQFMGAAIKVPYSLKTRQDIDWLRDNIGQEYWEEARQAGLKEKARLEQKEAENRRRQLGLQDLPAEFVNRTVKTEQKQKNYAGKYFVRNNILGFVDSEGFVSLTPVLKSKVEILEEANYKEAPTGFSVPYSNGTEQDLEFIRRHLSQQEIDLTLEEIAAEQQQTRKEQVRKIKEKRKLQELPRELLERSAVTGFEDLQLMGRYCSRSGVTCFICEDGYFYVTPTVPWKEKALREAGFREPDHLIRVPYASGTEEDRHWLEQNLLAGELEKSRLEVGEQEKKQEREKFRKLLEERGIDDKVPEELAQRSAMTDTVMREQVGRYLVEDDFLGFIGPDGHIWITPETPGKVELLKKANYEYANTKISLPHVGSLAEDAAWRDLYLPKGEEERSRQEVMSLKKESLDHKAKEIAAKRAIKDLPEDFFDRCVRTETVAVEMIGRYLERFGMVYLIAPDRYLYLTPSTPGKLKTIKEAGYQFPEKIIQLPYSSESELEWIKENLPEGELDRCRKELENLEKTKVDGKIAQNMEKFSLTQLPEELLERSADSGHRDPKNIGRLGIFRGVLAFVRPDEKTYVTWYTEEKQETLEDCGYKQEGYMPIKVPYAMQDETQRQWLLVSLPEPDEEEKLSEEENAG
ncbi:MAG: hypothetical protein JXQ83_03270 [Candidatus Glassbacteria bacterium]|nr:hypothetical protein [Candidatus Glassbacteria bacterium]